jgi:hypothetical protein
MFDLPPERNNPTATSHDIANSGNSNPEEEIQDMTHMYDAEQRQIQGELTEEELVLGYLRRLSEMDMKDKIISDEYMWPINKETCEIVQFLKDALHIPAIIMNNSTNPTEEKSTANDVAIIPVLKLTNIIAPFAILHGNNTHDDDDTAAITTITSDKVNNIHQHILHLSHFFIC